MLIRLILAHAIADFPLQTNTIYNYKEKSKKGILLHVLIHFLTSYVLLFNMFNLKLLGIVSLIAIIHFFQDWFKLYLQKKHEIFNRTFAFIFDQVLHIIVVFISYYYISKMLFGFIPHNFFPVSYSDKIGLLLSLSILASFGGCVAIYFIDKSILKRNITYKKEYSGLLERMLIPIIIYLKMNIIYLLLLIVIRALYYYIYNNRKEFKIIRTVNLILSPVIALLLSIIIFYI